MDPFRTGPTGLFATALVSLGKSGRFSLGVVPKPTAIANRPVSFDAKRQLTIGLYRDVWIAAIASSTTSLATRTAAICVRFQRRRVRHAYVTMQVTFLTRKSALLYRRGLRQRVASLTLNGNGDFAIRAYGLVLISYGMDRNCLKTVYGESVLSQIAKIKMTGSIIGPVGEKKKKKIKILKITGSIIGPAMAGPTGPSATALRQLVLMPHEKSNFNMK